MQEVTSKNAGMSKEGSDVEPSAPVPLVFPVPTVPAPDVSPTAVSSESAKDLPPPNWEMWRTRGACRIWQAVLISMAINPTSEVRTILRREQPRRYAQYINRKEAVTAQYGLRPELPATAHPKQGKRSGEKYILLSGLLAMGKEQGWHDIDAFEKGMRTTAANSTAADIVNASFEGRPRIQRNALVRMGALLQLLEEVLKKGVHMNAATLLHGSELNISKVASRVEQIICSAAEAEKVADFKTEANRKQFGEAKQVLSALWRESRDCTRKD